MLLFNQYKDEKSTQVDFCLTMYGYAENLNSKETCVVDLIKETHKFK